MTPVTSLCSRETSVQTSVFVQNDHVSNTQLFVEVCEQVIENLAKSKNSMERVILIV
jgi:hypothetical protein